MSGPANGACRSLCAHGFDPGFVFGDVLVEVVPLGAKELVFAEAVGFVADDEGDEAVAHDCRDGCGLVGCAGGASTGEVEAIDQAPVHCIEEAFEVFDGLMGDDALLVVLNDGIDEGPLPVVFDAVTDAAKLFRVVETDALPRGDVAEVSSETQDAVVAEAAKGGDQCGVLRREEVGVVELSGLVAQAREVEGHQLCRGDWLFKLDCNDALCANLS